MCFHIPLLGIYKPFRTCRNIMVSESNTGTTYKLISYIIYEIYMHTAPFFTNH